MEGKTVKVVALIFALGAATYAWWRLMAWIREEMRKEGLNV